MKIQQLQTGTRRAAGRLQFFDNLVPLAAKLLSIAI